MRAGIFFFFNGAFFSRGGPEGGGRFFARKLSLCALRIAGAGAWAERIEERAVHR